MKILRIAGLIVFLLSAAAYMGYKVYQSQSKDTMGPNIIFSNDDISVNVHATDEELLQNVTATDNKDGDVTKSLMIEKISRLTDGNKRTITYAAFDSSNHITRAQREMVYTDYVSPRFQLSEPLRYTVGDTSNLLK
ncbi:MAG TPA: hypothetical protein VN131_02855, partial [Mobilitalea sp.]|nr:hypothetical protein [Mobilitalea sp.]